MANILFTIFDVLNFGLVVFLWWFTIKKYKTLPERIPIHFDFEGKADNFGSKGYSFLMPILGLMFYGMFLFVANHPESANFPVKITESNKDAQFFIMILFLKWIFMLVLLIFLNSQDHMFRSAFDETSKPRVSMATMLLSVIASLIIVFIVVAQFK